MREEPSAVNRNLARGDQPEGRAGSPAGLPTTVRALHAEPITAVAAQIVPEKMAPRLLSAVCTGAVALRVGKLWAALLVGMAVYWGQCAAGA